MSFSDKLKDILEKSVDSSRDFIEKAGAQAQTWGEMGKLKIEIAQMRSQAHTLTTKLGAEVYRLLIEEREPMIGASTESLAPLLNGLSSIERSIDEKEAAFKRAGGKESDFDKSGD